MNADLPARISKNIRLDRFKCDIATSLGSQHRRYRGREILDDVACDVYNKVKPRDKIIKPEYTLQYG